MNLPRKGRKGGKVTTPATSITGSGGAAETATANLVAPAVAASTTPSVSDVAEGAAASSAGVPAAGSSSSDPSTQPSSATTNELSGSTELPTSGAEALKNSSSWIDNKNQIRKDTAQHVARGNLVRGLRSTQTSISAPESSVEVVREKLKEVLEKQLAHHYDPNTDLRECLDVVSNHQVTIISPHDCLLLAAQLLSERNVSGPGVLVIVTDYAEISAVANALRKILKARNEKVEVSEFFGAWTSGERNYPLYVTDAETAILYLSTKASFSPFTHVLLPEFPRVTPMLSLLLNALRRHLEKGCGEVLRSLEVAKKQKRKTEVRLRSEAEAKEEGKSAMVGVAKVIIGATFKISEKLSSFFSWSDVRTSGWGIIPFKTTVTARPVPENAVEFSYDECCALAEMKVLQLVGSSSLRLPEKKAMQHCVAVAAELIKFVTKESPFPVRIHVYTGDCNAVLEGLRSAASCKEVVLLGKQDIADRSPFSPPLKGAEGKSVVYVLSGTACPSLCGFLPPHFVLDFGTIAQAIQTGRTEGLAGGYLCVWSSTEDLEEHRRIAISSGGYFHLYPALSDARASTIVSSPVTELERSWLQAVRNHVIGIWEDNPLLSIPSPVTTTVKSHLTNVCLTTESLQLTLNGEIAARLPLNINLANFVISACALHLGELGIVVASVARFSMRHPQYSLDLSGEDVTPWAARIEASRREFAPGLVNESDILADAVAYLEWHRLTLEGSDHACTILPAKLGVSVSQLQRIRQLITVLCIQLSDYLQLEDLESPAVAAVLQKRLLTGTDSTLISFLYAASLARQAAIFRSSESKVFFEGGDAVFAFVRTTRKMIASPCVPSHVVLGSESTLISTDIDTGSTTSGFEGARFTVLNTEFFHATLLLLYPTIVYSSPQLEDGAGQRWYSVSFGLVCNGHRKRYRLPISQAESILQFRRKWNLALDFLYMYRSLSRPVSQNLFFDALRAKNRCFNLGEFLLSLKEELHDLVISIEASEHHGNVDCTFVHSLGADPDVLSTTVESTDKALLRSVDSLTSETSPSWDELKSGIRATTDHRNASENSLDLFSSSLEEDSEVQSIEALYFLTHDPILDS